MLCAQTGMAQTLTPDVKAQIGQYLNQVARQEVSIGKINIDSVAVEGRTLQLFANMNCSYYPFREDNVKQIYADIASLLPAEWKGFKVELHTNRRTIEELIPQALRSRKDKKALNFCPTLQANGKRAKDEKPLTQNLSRAYRIDKGLQDRHIALWQSHGWYYEGKLNRWEWQRARIFQTVEDLYTQSYVLPFLVPMLENAGAQVLIPRERDWQTHEVIVDNDGNPFPAHNRSLYAEYNGEQAWQNGLGEGFAHLRTRYAGFENPFKEGTYRTVQTIKKGKESVAEWTPDIPAKGKYAVYVAYQTVKNSTDDALYTVHHAGGVTQFRVNQQMGGGTWIYLGTFGFEAGKNNGGKITLSNRSAKEGRILSADGVKIGGGMGNIARYIPTEATTSNVKSSAATNNTSAPANHEANVLETAQIKALSQTSGYPRFCEAARYWMQWAGVPDSVYSTHHGTNDYTDDYKSRGLWVNYIAGGSSVNPQEQGLRIPVDLAFAFHTDAGTTLNDSTIGTLGIYQTDAYEGKFANGASRYLSHDLTDLIMSHIVRDVRTLYEPRWSRRGMWNQSYYEARVPRVPTMLLELLSHQNFADMRYGLDPRFRFTVSRAIYKGMLQFIASQRGTAYVVQPLPVEEMALQTIGDNEIELSWKPVDDPQEPTAKAERYVVYTRVGDGEFDNGTLVNGTSYRATLPTGVVCSYRVAAVNAGGESFPSETLSAGRAFNERGKVLIVNGFDRISAPADFVAPAPADKQLAGFLDEIDHGVPYMQDISYIGSMKEYRRHIPWMDDDASGFGDSYGNYETQVIAGNTFDYPSIHGEALLKAGYSFVSCSDEAIERGMMKLNDYRYADLILGKECQTKMGRGGVKPLQFKTFSKEMQQAINAYCAQGGNLLVSGAFVGSDLWDNRLTAPDKADQEFATETLKYKWRVGQAATTGKVKGVNASLLPTADAYEFFNQLNEQSYVVESPDAIEPVCPEAQTVLRYAENNLSAGVAYRGDYRTFIMGFPFESLQTATQRETLMKQIMNFFSK